MVHYPFWSFGCLRLRLTSLGGERELLFMLSSGRGVARGSHTCNFLRAGCGQEEPGSIMRGKLATGSCHERKSSNRPRFNKKKKKKKPINREGVPASS